MTDKTYNRTSLVTALKSAVGGARLGTTEIRNLIDSRESNMELVAVELTSVFYELGFSSENKDFFNGSFRSMLRNALKAYGAYGVKVSYKRTREYTDGDRELTADDNGNWFWHVEIAIVKRVQDDETYQAVADSHDVVGQPVEVTETERAINKVLESEKIDRVQATSVMLQSLTGPAAAHVIQAYLESTGINSIRDIKKAAQVQPELAKAANS